MVQQILSYAAIFAGFVSAVLWWKAATVVVRKGDPRAAKDIFIGGNAVQTTAREQAKFNSWGAFATATAAALGALALLFSAR